MVLEVVLLPLVDIIEMKERVVELLAGFIKPFIVDTVADAILGMEEDVRVSIMKIYFQFENYLHSDTEDGGESKEEGNEAGEDNEEDVDEEDYVDSDVVREMARREVWREERARLKTFREEAWEIFRCAVFNGNLEPFRRVIESDDWWLPENSTHNVIGIGEFVAVIYQAIGGQV